MSSTNRHLERPLRRRDFLKAGALAAAGAALPAACARLPSFLGGRKRRPNIILVFTDDQAFDAIGYASDGRVKTPHLDRLASRGATFSRAYCSAMTCVPSRTTMLTGCNYDRVEKDPRARGWVRPLKEGTWSWPHALRQAGYRTALIGKGHFTPMWANHGFDVLEICDMPAKDRIVEEGQPKLNQYEEFLKTNGIIDYYANYGFNFPKDKRDMLKAFRENMGCQAWPHDSRYHRISWVRDRSLAFIEDCRAQQVPYALILSIPFPHAPYTPSQEFIYLYDPSNISVPTDHWDDMANMPEGFKKRAQADGHDRTRYSKKQLQNYFAHYWALVSQIDAAVGTLVEHVDMANTLLVFTSDHGDYQGRRGRLTKVPWIPFEETARIPLFATGLGAPGGIRVDSPVALVDLAPTFLRAAGVETPPGLDGVALQNYFKDPAYGANRAFLCNGFFGAYMVGWRNWRYLELPNRTAPMLFDLNVDPGQLNNLAGSLEFQEIAATMRRKLDEILAKPKPDLPHFETLTV